MKFNEALEMSMTTTSDVEGIKKKVGSVVRRKVPAGYTEYKKKKKRKKKNENK
jgi:hypothetical protein